MKKNHYLLIVMLVLGYISVAAQEVTISTKEEFKAFLISTDTYEGKTIAVSGYGSSSSSYGYGSAGRRKKQLEKEHYAGSCSDLT